MRCCTPRTGQTGSGKTWTMSGVPDNPELAGIAPRAITELYRLMEADKDKAKYSTSLSMYELYRDKLEDLLDPKSMGKKSMRIRCVGAVLQQRTLQSVLSLTRGETGSAVRYGAGTSAQHTRPTRACVAGAHAICADALSAVCSTVPLPARPCRPPTAWTPASASWLRTAR